jgi:hypothetical protein
VGATEFVAVQIRMTLQIADSRAWQRIAAHRSELPERCNFPLAKVGVEGSNPFARSNFLKPKTTAEGSGFDDFPPNETIIA